MEYPDHCGWCDKDYNLATMSVHCPHDERPKPANTRVIYVRDYQGPVVAATCAKCQNDNLKPFGGPALNFCSHCGAQFPHMFGNTATGIKAANHS